MNQVLRNKLDEGISQQVFPSAELLCASEGKIVHHEKVGKTSQNDLYFDLASLTKPLCTALLTMIFCEKKIISLDDKVGKFFATQTLDEITVRQILSHTSGLIDWAPLYADKISMPNPDFEKNRSIILDLILKDDYFLRDSGKTVYSDIGYILLGALLETAGRARLHQLFETHITNPLHLSDKIFFVPLTEVRRHAADQFIETEFCPFRNRVIQGEVMDKNSYAMGGVTGHAGLFSTAETIHQLLSELRRASLGQSSLLTKDSFDLFCRPDLGRNWQQAGFTLGFDTPTQGKSQSGSQFSKNSIGHLGYSGTSFWWDLDKDLWIILLTNRCMPNRKNFKIQQFRPELYDLAYGVMS